ncbi:cation transporter [Azoarcus sp. DD4]|uniref:cation transporter n=1 Tax=Azoarcus sp. DD4 TaxID=2027405 RepID=UPI00112C8772|nr:cation transporter [Azoarcus sp. DD4]QDF98364.1 cation transporter [Azoarcus sp. DD4]
MPGCSCGSSCASQTSISPRFRRALWVALVINALMFGVELVAGLHVGSVSLLADAVDFAGDAANYGISLAVLSLGLAWRSRAALVKGASMAGYGVFVLGKSVWAAFGGVPPEPVTMGAVALLALLANAGVALMLYAFREGDANMRSVWLCSRNDAIGNIAVILAAAGVFGTGQGWPDIVVAGVMAGLALSSGLAVIRLARHELAQRAAPAESPVLVTLGATSPPDRSG